MRSIACWACVPISAPGISAESSQALAAGATLLAYGEYTVRNGKLEVRTHNRRRAQPQGHQSDRSVRAGRRCARRRHCPGPSDLHTDRPLRHTQSGRAGSLHEGAWKAATPPSWRWVSELRLPPTRILSRRIDCWPRSRRSGRIRAGAVATLDQALARGTARPRIGPRPPGIGIRRIDRKCGRAPGGPFQARQNWIAAMPPPGVRWASR